MARKKTEEKRNQNITPEGIVEEAAAVEEAVTEAVEEAAAVEEAVTEAAEEAAAEEIAEEAEAAEEEIAEEAETAAEKIAEAAAAEAETAAEEIAEAAEITEEDAAEEDAVADEVSQLEKELQEKEKELAEQQEKILELQKDLKKQQKELKIRRKKQKRIKRSDNKKTSGAEEAAEKGEVKFANAAEDMNDALKGLLSDDIHDMKQKEKTRTAEILAIFAKHNFYADGMTPEELRTTLEDLGPTYVKIGQIMSSRVDMLPEEYCTELGKLRENVKPLDSSIARAAVETELGGNIEDIFSDFVDVPLGSASIGQVHKATLKDGTDVVIKVQRPLISDMMHKDFMMLEKVASAAKTLTSNKGDNEETFDFLSALRELEKVTNEELDFRVEAKNTIDFKEKCIGDDTRIGCPTIYPDMTSERIMTMTYVDGYSVGKLDRLIADGYDPNEIGRIMVENYVHQVLDVGTFHADPHQGNIMVSKGKPYWIDFGMIGHISKNNVKAIEDLILSLVYSDTEKMVDAVLRMAGSSPKTDRNKLSEDVDFLINKYTSVTNLEELDIVAMLDDVSNAMTKNHLSIPGEFTMLIRSVSSIEGVLEELCPELNLFTLLSDEIIVRARKSFDLQQTLTGVGKDAVAMGRKATTIPGLAADALTSVVKGRAKINLEPTGYEPILDQLTDTVASMILAFFASMIFFGSCILCLTDIEPKVESGMPLVAMFGFLFSIALAVYTVKRIMRKK